MTLVLARLKGEQIIIGEPGKVPVIVTMEWARNGKARIGVQADEDVGVFRREVYERMFGPLEPGMTLQGRGVIGRSRRRKPARSA